MKKIEIVGIVPVKANSERIKKKNLRQFGNTNLFELKLKQLQKTKSFKYIVVSSEDKKILSIAKKKGFQNTFARPILFHKQRPNERSVLLHWRINQRGACCLD